MKKLIVGLFTVIFAAMAQTASADGTMLAVNKDIITVTVAPNVVTKGTGSLLLCLDETDKGDDPAAWAKQIELDDAVTSAGVSKTINGATTGIVEGSKIRAFVMTTPDEIELYTSMTKPENTAAIIPTGYCPGTKTKKIELDFGTTNDGETSGNNWVLGLSCSKNSTVKFRLGASRSGNLTIESGLKGLNIYGYNNNTDSASLSSTAFTTGKATLALPMGAKPTCGLVAGGSVATGSKALADALSVDCPESICVFGRRTYDTETLKLAHISYDRGNMTVWGFRAYEDDVDPVAECLPAKMNGVPGLYDMVGKKFYSAMMTDGSDLPSDAFSFGDALPKEADVSATVDYVGGGAEVPKADYYVGKMGSDASVGTADAPFATIGHAIEVAAIAGVASKIYVFDGIYTEHGLSLSAAIELFGNLSDPSKVILQAAENPILPDSVDKTCVGRCIEVNNSSAHLHHMTIRNGSSDNDGGGNIRIASGLISDCVVCDGYAKGTNPWGGNIGVRGGASEVRLMRCAIYGGYVGGNSTKQGGSSVAVANEKAVIENCLITGARGNATKNDLGAALYLNANCTVVNCTIAGNGVGSASTSALGVYASSGKIYNSAVYNNGGTAAREWGSKNPGNYVGCAFSSAAAFTGTAIKDVVDDDFADLTTYALSPRSRLINAGDNSNYSTHAISTTDLAGVDRIRRGKIDIGAYELRPNSGLLLIFR